MVLPPFALATAGLVQNNNQNLHRLLVWKRKHSVDDALERRFVPVERIVDATRLLPVALEDSLVREHVDHASNVAVARFVA